MSTSNSISAQKIWKWLNSMRLNLFLLILIAGVSVFGSIIPQGEDPAFYRQSYGPLRAAVINYLQMYDIFHSWWFLVLCFFLTASILACSANRLLPLWRLTMSFRQQYGEDFYTGSSIRDQSFSQKSSGEAANILFAGLQKRHYRVFRENSQEGFYLYADRGRFGSFGSLLVHLSLVLIITGALYGRVEGYKGYVSIPEGGLSDIQKAGFALQLDSFRVDYYGDYMPRQYYSDLRVIDRGQEVMKKVISVNNPLTYKGVTFYQTSFGWVVDGALKSGGKETKINLMEREAVFLGGGLSIKIMFYPDFYINESGHPGTKSPLPNNPRVFYVVYQGSRALAYNLASLNEPVQIGAAMTLTFTGYRQYTGLQFASDPGIPAVYLGSALMILGLFLNFYVIPHRIWFMVTNKPSGCRILAAGSSPRFQARLEEEIDALTAEAAGPNAQ